MTDHIYLFSPSGAIEPATLERATANLQTLGYKVSVDRTAAKRHMRFAGTDAERIAAFDRAAASKASIVMATRGGYGLSRILHHLDFPALLKSHKKWVGFSDFTAFHLGALAASPKSLHSKKLYAGPTASFFSGPLVENFSADKLDEVTLGSFQETMNGSTEAVGWVAKGSPACASAGVLWGGNLCMVASLIGTPFMPKARGLFFCEDVGEYPYRSERLFAQLLHAGILQKQKAVILGHFNKYQLSANDAGFDIPVVVKWLRAELKAFGVPVITGLPYGHVPTILTLPLGRKVELIVERGSAFLVYAHQHS
jgi:muramoyltetrapeptide carboxypeptidase